MSNNVTQVTPELAQRVAEAWVKAWNEHDLEAILSHYADTLHFMSPNVVKRMGRADGTIRTKAELRDYFGHALKTQPTFHFDLDDVLVGVDSVALYYRNHRGQRAVEMMHLDDKGKVYRVVVNYREERQ